MSLPTSYEAWLEQEEERTMPPMSAGQYDREETYIGGANKPDSEWLLSDRDCWYRNPFFTGTRTEGHPEDDSDRYYDALSPEEKAEHERLAAEYRAQQDEEYLRRRTYTILSELEGDDDIPF